MSTLAFLIHCAETGESRMRQGVGNGPADSLSVMDVGPLRI